MQNDRAKIFMPFDALKGLKEAYREKEKVLVEKIDLTEDDLVEISKNLMRIKKGDLVEIIYYKDFEYIKLIGLTSNINLVLQEIEVVKTKIKFDDLLKLNIVNENIF